MNRIEPSLIPGTRFRLEHGFSIKPPLVVDRGPSNGVAVGRTRESDDQASLYLGKLAETPFSDVWLDGSAAHVVYVMGKRRSGKSHTLGVIAEGLAAQGWIRQGAVDQGILILDTMNVFLTMPFGSERLAADSATLAEVRKWRVDGESIETNLFHPRGSPIPEGLDSTEIALRPSDLGPEEWCGLFEADPFSDPLGHLITEVHAKTAADGYRDRDTGRDVDPNPDFVLGDLLRTLAQDPDIDRYHRDTRESLRRRLDAVRRLPVFSDHGLDVRKLIQPGSVSILLLRDLDQQMRAVMVGLIVKLIMQLRGYSEQFERMIPIHVATAANLETSDPSAAAVELKRAEECREAAALGVPRCWVIIDEAHNYVPSSGSTPSRRPLKKYVDEGRNLGLSIVVATQQPSGIDPSIQRNADVLLVHSLSHHVDIAAAEGMINTSVPTEVVIDTRDKLQGSRPFESLVRKLPTGYALLSTDRANRLFAIRVRPRSTVHGGGDY